MILGFGINLCVGTVKVAFYSPQIKPSKEALAARSSLLETPLTTLKFLV